MEDKIVSSDFKLYLEKQFGKNLADITSAELNSINEVSLNRKNYSGDLKNYDLIDLGLLPNLKSIALKNFIIEKKEMDIINSLTSLSTLEFYNCSFSGEYKLTNHAIKNVTFDVCDNVNENMIQCVELNALQIVGLESEKTEFNLAEMSNLENLKILSINNYIIKNIDAINQKLPSVRDINFDGSVVGNELQFDQEEISYSHKDRFFEIQ